MITYEEFLKQNYIQKLELLNFTNDKQMVFDAQIEDSISEYIDVAKKAENLNFVLVPVTQTSGFYEELNEFIENCNDNVSVSNDVFIGKSNKQEFLEGEKIINQVVSEINPDWTDKQKLAFVHYKMGELISYIPDFNFKGKYLDSPETNDSRNIWRSLCKGQSVCNGVTFIQRTILSRVGVETEELSSGSHSFMLTKTAEGNIITDATWDLDKSLFKAFPTNFGVSYEELRKREKGLSNSHKLDNPPENVLEISDEELRNIYQSIGIIGDDKVFPLPIFKKEDEINTMHFDTKKDKLNAFLNMFTTEFSKEATHLQETRQMLEVCIAELGFDSKDITSKFVYSNTDKDCHDSILVFHINSEGLKNIVKMLNLDKMTFDDIDLETLDKKYRVHDEDKCEPFWESYLKEKSQKIQQNQEIQQDIEKE